MQQVGRQHFAMRSAAVDPRLLPVPLRPTRTRMRPLVGFGHFWVLHHRRVTRVALALIVCLMAAAGYVFRDDVSLAIGQAGALASQGLVEAGFGIDTISMTGQSLTSEAAVLGALELSPETSIFTLDAAAIRDRLESLASVETATVRKIYPSEVVVTLAEPEPVARWRMDGETRLIDSWGEPVARALADDAELPLVIGAGAGDDALPMINLMARYPEVGTDLAALARIGDRRWDLIYYTGLRVQLPETGVAAALQRLDDYQAVHQLLERDVSLIDLRLPGAVAVLPVARDDQEDDIP